MSTPAAAWSDAVAATIADLQAAVTAMDWSNANALAVTLNEQLYGAPPGADREALDVYGRARAAIERVAIAAGEARENAGEDLLAVSRGRKAVTAYG